MSFSVLGFSNVWALGPNFFITAREPNNLLSPDIAA